MKNFTQKISRGAGRYLSARILLYTFAMTAMFIALFVTSCASSQISRRQEPHTYSRGLPFSVTVPANWTAQKNRRAQSLQLTVHSPRLEFAQIRRYQLPVKFAHSELQVNQHMYTFEAAEIVLSNLRVSGAFDLAVDEIAPVVIDGCPAFRAFGRYYTDNGLPRQFLIFGIMHGEKYYTEIALHALAGHYFTNALPDFLSIVDSFVVDGRRRPRGNAGRENVVHDNAGHDNNVGHENVGHENIEPENVEHENIERENVDHENIEREDLDI